MPLRARRCCTLAGARAPAAPLQGTQCGGAHPQAPGPHRVPARHRRRRRPTAAGQVRTTGAQGAGILRSMSEANALVVLHHDQGSVAAGDEVEVWLFDGLV
jgi:molybdopterin molybdotransferase